MGLRVFLVLLAMAAVIAIPFALRPERNLLADADDTIIIISPHNEAIRYEFTRAFSEFYERQTGRTVRIDWRIVGGTSEIARFIASEFFSAFRREWESGGRRWTPEVEGAFDNPSADPHADGPASEARRAFLQSSTGIGIDLFFGGGAYDFNLQARAGRLVSSGILESHPDWHADSSIPPTLSGEHLYDPEGRWIGACLSAFGICYNADSLRRLGFDQFPASWSTLTDPRLFKQVALADPTKSGSAAKAFEMVLQQQMQEALRRGASEEDGIREGWLAGLRLIQAASANARYFTDAAGKVPMDVSLGDAAAGMCIDFYGRFQSEAVALPDGSSRLEFFTPAGGSSVGPDPIAILRGAPNPRPARKFMEFVLSIDGQKLWNFRPGTPGGPTRYALRRSPIRKELYSPEFLPFASDPAVDPYRDAHLFEYHPEWSAPLFRAMSFIIRVMCLDTHREQTDAWREILAAGMPVAALERFADLHLVDYERARSIISPILKSPDRLGEVRMARELAAAFRQQYLEAAALARMANPTAVSPKEQ